MKNNLILPKNHTVEYTIKGSDYFRIHQFDENEIQDRMLFIYNRENEFSFSTFLA